MILNENTGERPSKFQIARFVTGELEGEEAKSVARWLESSAEGQSHLREIEAAKAAVAPFDASLIRRRNTPTPANNNRAFLAMIPVLLMAALAMFVVVPALRGPDVDPSYVGTRSSVGIQLFHLEAEGLSRYDNRKLGEGDVVGFQVMPGAHKGVVVLSVDGNGQVSVFYPASGTAPLPVAGTGPIALPESVVLDGAPGPETFIAVFDQDVPTARAEVERVWQAGGKAGLDDWAAKAGHVDLAVVNRK